MTASGDVVAADNRRPYREGARKLLATEIKQSEVMPMEFTAVFERVPEGYIAFVEELPVQTRKAIPFKKHVGIFFKRCG